MKRKQIITRALLGIAIALASLTAYSRSRESLVYSVSRGGRSITVISTRRNVAEETITVNERAERAVPGILPNAIAITPNGEIAYITANGLLLAVDLETQETLAELTGFNDLYDIAITPDATKAYVTNSGNGNVTPIDLATNTALADILVGDTPTGIAITPDGTTAYVADYINNTLVSLDLATNTVGTPIPVGNGPVDVAISFDGTRAYVVNFS